MKRHALVVSGSESNLKFKPSYIMYEKNLPGFSMEETIKLACKKQKLKAPVFLLETGSGVKMFNRLY